MLAVLMSFTSTALQCSLSRPLLQQYTGAHLSSKQQRWDKTEERGQVAMETTRDHHADGQRQVGVCSEGDQVCLGVTGVKGWLESDGAFFLHRRDWQFLHCIHTMCLLSANMF